MLLLFFKLKYHVVKHNVNANVGAFTDPVIVPLEGIFDIAETRLNKSAGSQPQMLFLVVYSHQCCWCSTLVSFLYSLFFFLASAFSLKHQVAVAFQLFVHAQTDGVSVSSRQLDFNFHIMCDCTYKSVLVCGAYHGVHWFFKFQFWTVMAFQGACSIFNSGGLLACFVWNKLKACIVCGDDRKKKNCFCSNDAVTSPVVKIKQCEENKGW